MGLFKNIFKKIGDYMEAPASNEEFFERLEEFYEKVVELEKEGNVQGIYNKPFIIGSEEFKSDRPAARSPLTFIEDGKIYKLLKRTFLLLTFGELEETEQYQKNIAFAIRASYDSNSDMSLTEFEKQGYLKNIKLVYEPSQTNSNLTVAVYSDSFKVGYINEKDVKKAEWILEKLNNDDTSEILYKVSIVEYNGLKNVLIEIPRFSFDETEYVNTLTSELKERFNLLIEWNSQLNTDIPKNQIKEELSNISTAVDSRRRMRGSRTNEEFIRNNIMIK